MLRLPQKDGLADLFQIASKGLCSVITVHSQSLDLD